MRFLTAIHMWLRALWRRERVEDEMEREMRLHLEMQTDENIRHGMSPDEARRHATIAFGGLERQKEAVRDERGTRGLEALVSEFRFGIRTLAKNKAFAILAIATLAIGIGATSGVYSLANWVLLRPVPGIAEPDELVIVSFEDGPGQPTGFSFATLEHVRRSVDAFTGVLGTHETRIHLSGEGIAAREIEGAIVGGDYFDVLGVRPARGRFFTNDELAPTNAARVAVISWALFESQFASDPAVVGRKVRFNANEFTIVGVAPREFRGIARIGRTEAWFPASVYGVLRHENWDLTQPEFRVMFFMVGRLKPGASVQLAQQQVLAAADGLLATDPKAFGILESHRPQLYTDVGTPIYGRPRVARMFRMLFAIVTIVLAIACANVANLLLMRGLARRPEFAVRKALGASMRQLLRLHTVEGLLIGLAGGALAVGVTLLVAQIFEATPFVGRAPDVDIHIDQRVIGFVFLLAVATGFLFGLVPGIATIRDRSSVALGDAGRRATGGGAGSRLRAALMVVQVSGSVALIAIALLLARTIQATERVPLGFDPHGITAAALNPRPQGYSPERLRSLRIELEHSLRSEPGVASVNISEYGLPQRSVEMVDLRPAALVTEQWPFEGRKSAVSPGYFATLGIPLLAGSDFTAAVEGDSAVPVILNETAARELFGDANPVGQVVVERIYKGTVRHQVIGVVGDARAASVREPQGGVLYVPIGAGRPWNLSIVLRSQRPAGDVEAMLRRVVGRIDPSLPVGPVTTAEAVVEEGTREERVFLKLVGVLGLLAIVLAAVGLYGLTAYSVMQRRREIGIRIALGASVRSVINIVMRRAALIATIGVGAGLLAAAILARALEKMLFGVERLDLVSYAGAALFFALVATAACIVPARLAASVDPTEALRAE